MGQYTDIPWADSTRNAVMGCGGCELWNDDVEACYTGNDHGRKEEAIAKGKIRGYAPIFHQVTRFPGRIEAASRWPGFEGLVHPRKPWLTSSPRMIFISDMGDALSPHKLIWLGPSSTVHVPGLPLGYTYVVPDTDWDYLCVEIIKNVMTPEGRRHIWLWLSKLPLVMARFSVWLCAQSIPWPANLWAGTSVTESKFLYRIDQLKDVGDENTKRFLSIEPQLGLLSIREYLNGEIHWVIQGGESGARLSATKRALPVVGKKPSHVARPFDVAWARALRDECKDANVPFFVKQLGTNVVDNGQIVNLVRDRDHGEDWSEWSQDIAVREVPGVDLKFSRPR